MHSNYHMRQDYKTGVHFCANPEGERSQPLVIGVGRELVGSDSLPDEVGFERGRYMMHGAKCSRRRSRSSKRPKAG